MLPRHLQDLLGLGLLFGLVLLGDWRRRFDWYDPTTGNRLCRAAPDAIHAWAHRTFDRSAARDRIDRDRLDAWLNTHRAGVNRQYGAFCEPSLHKAALVHRHAKD